MMSCLARRRRCAGPAAFPARPARILAAALAATALATSPLAAQRPGIRDVTDVELELLRAASAREAAGDLPGAERVLRLLLERRPASPAGILALERVLRARGDLRGILAAVDVLLSEEPRSAVGHLLKLRIMTEVDSVGGMTEAAEVWMRADPRSEEPYREIARVYGRRGGARTALQVLERGRAAVGDSTALAVELGELRIRANETERGVAEWSRALGEEARDVSSVLRSLAGLRQEHRELAGRLVDALVAEPTTLARRRAAAQIAVETAQNARAIQVAEALATELEGRARYGFFADLARRAEESGAVQAALWAYAQLRVGAQHAGERLALDQRIATMAEAAGDREIAVEAYRRVAGTSERGSGERRRALVAIVRLDLGQEDLEAMGRDLGTLRGEFPEAPELDRLAADIAGWLVARGEVERAREILAGLEGPWSARERAFLHLAIGDLAGGRAQLLQAAQGLPPGQATSAIAVARLLGNVDPPTGRAVAEAAVLARQGRARDAEERLTETASRAAPGDRPALLALAAQFAEDAGRGDRALELRRRIAREHAEAPEAPEAMLEAAQALATQPGGLTEAIQLLERIILTQPQSAVVPQARRELERLRGRIPRS
ncbi:MAG: hypothetical protein HY704_16160 [Gemmatimonadetes bacterium]|nr:hypothetical protein [Gemmatimonadota bacterium]